MRWENKASSDFLFSW